ncbi:DNA/RNA nuclease SfsA [Oryzibacter oryziterrae]|uniref:DNA/RNA nuclease SfsA n=1 Tax=Oryzibacter oryziterrae TaxID=2766474 RepID=UPI001F005BDE|nr:DNA/RNA nuclease SfsA [Oryzibacter oryziterrae]
MRFDKPLTPGRLIKRYKRFLADVLLDSGEVITAHVANSGSMMGLCEPGLRVWLSRSDDPKRKLAWSWELVETAEGALVGINTSHPNAIVADAIRAGHVPALAGYDSLRREVKYGRNSRIDILLEAADRAPCYVEVKNCTLARQAGLAEFPDAVTSRGAKHLQELSDMVAAGHRAVMAYLVQRNDCDRFEIAADIDPVYAASFAEATTAGVEVLVLRCALSLETVEISHLIPLA